MKRAISVGVSVQSLRILNQLLDDSGHQRFFETLKVVKSCVSAGTSPSDIAPAQPARWLSLAGFAFGFGGGDDCCLCLSS
jgi:hypothetical protein